VLLKEVLTNILHGLELRFWTRLRFEPLLCCSISLSLSFFLSSVWNVHVSLSTTLLLSYIVKALYCYMVLICSYSYLEYFPTAVSRIGVHEWSTDSYVGVARTLMTSRNWLRRRNQMMGYHCCQDIASNCCVTHVLWVRPWLVKKLVGKRIPVFLPCEHQPSSSFLFATCGNVACDPGEREHAVRSGPPWGYFPLPGHPDR